MLKLDIFIILEIISVLFLTISAILCWNKLLSRVLDFKNKTLYIIWFSFTITTILNYNISNMTIKFVISTLIMVLFIKFLFSINFKDSIILAVITQMLCVISEVFALVVIYILSKLISIDLMTFEYCTYFADILTSLVLIFTCRIKFVTKFFIWLKKCTDNISSKTMIIFVFIFLFLTNIYLSLMYNKLDLIHIIFINSFTIILMFITTIDILNSKNNLIRVQNKYLVSINSLTEYEEIVNKFRVLNHETRNQFMTLRGLISKNNKNALKFVDGILDFKDDQNNKLLKNFIALPKGGIRAIIYSKMSLMEDLNLNYKLNIDKKIKGRNIIELSENLTVNICQVLGVFLDNAIEESKTLKNNFIYITLYLENSKLVIKISNLYDKTKSLESIYGIGYSTKGNDRGYGLSLCELIIKENKELFHKTEISNDLFSQVLFIDVKK